VDAVRPAIQAAFVDSGREKSAFRHASDLVRETAEEAEDEEDDEEQTDEPIEKKNGNGSNGNGRRAKAPLIEEALKRGQEILVQVSKEPISTKGPRVTAQISLAGRFLVFIPDSSKVGVSRKIGSSAERARLKEQVQAILPDKSGGVIVRTVSEDVTPEMLDRELKSLMSQWKKIKRITNFQKAPSLVNRESGLTRGLVRDLFSDKVDSLTVDSKQVYNEIVAYLKEIAPDLIARVRLHDSELPLFDTAEIESEIRDIF